MVTRETPVDPGVGTVGTIRTDLRYETSSRVDKEINREFGSDCSNRSKVDPSGDAVNLLTMCRTKGIRLWAGPDGLRYDAPSGALDTGLRDALKAQKASLLALLTAGTTPIEPAESVEPVPGSESEVDVHFGSNCSNRSRLADDFARDRETFGRAGIAPGVAARLAYEGLVTRASVPWREALAGWSIERRRRWGKLANRHESDGLDWREAERKAFDWIRGKTEGPDPEPRVIPAPRRSGPRPETGTELDGNRTAEEVRSPARE